MGEGAKKSWPQVDFAIRRTVTKSPASPYGRNRKRLKGGFSAPPSACGAGRELTLHAVH